MPNKQVGRCKNNHTELLLTVVGGKWTMAVIYTLQQNTLRFSVLERALPNVTQKSLTDTLRKLERNGMVDRYIYPTVPPQVEYKLTSLGLELLKLCSSLSNWSEQHYEEITKAQQAYNRRIKRHLLYLGYDGKENS